MVGDEKKWVQAVSDQEDSSLEASLSAFRSRFRELPEPEDHEAEVVIDLFRDPKDSYAALRYENIYEAAYRAAREVAIEGHTDNSGYDALL